MALEDSNAPAEGTAEQAPETLEASYESALNSLNQGTGNEEQQPDAEQEPPAPDPDHIKWVKSIDGDYDKDKGEINVDRLAKRAYELNKQAQTTAQKIASIERLMQRPEMREALDRVRNPQAPKQETKPEPEENLTDEQILKRWLKDEVDSRLGDVVNPLKQENQLLYAEYAKNQINNTLQQLKDEFGADEDGTPVYESVKDQVGQQLAAIASNANIPVEAFVHQLIRQNLLYQTLSSTARNILYPKLKERISAFQTKKVEDKKKFQMPGKGTPTGSVKKSEAKEINSIMEAAKAAELENPEFAKLV